MKRKFKIGDVVKVKKVTGITTILMKRPYRRLLKNMQMEIIGRIGKINKIEKNAYYKKNVIMIIIINKFDYIYRRFPLSFFENELANATEREKKGFLELENGYKAYDLARKL